MSSILGGGEEGPSRREGPWAKARSSSPVGKGVPKTAAKGKAAPAEKRGLAGGLTGKPGQVSRAASARPRSKDEPRLTFEPPKFGEDPEDWHRRARDHLVRGGERGRDDESP